MWLWRGEEQDGPNPYVGMLAWSDYVVVTADSVSRPAPGRVPAGQHSFSAPLSVTRRGVDGE